MLRKKAHLFVLSILFSQSMFSMKIDEKSLFVPERLGPVSLYHHKNNEFDIKTPRGSSSVQRCFMDKELRGIPQDKLKKLIATGSYISINKMNDSNEYSLKLMKRLPGGGVGGAAIGAKIGWFFGNILGYTAVGVVSAPLVAANPVVGGGAAAGITVSSTPFIQTFALKCAIVGGILGGIFSGPV